MSYSLRVFFEILGFFYIFSYLKFINGLENSIMKKTNQITIKDIASRLNLSASTVSRALNDHPDISDETKSLVREAAERLDYQPNSLALSLRDSKSNVIGVCIPEIKHHFFSSVFSGIENYSRQRGYHIIICQSSELVSREIENIRVLMSMRVDGFLISITKNTTDYKHLNSIEDKGIPVVYFDRPPQATDCDKVIIDDYASAFKITEHIISLGRKKIFHFAGPSTVRIGADRLRGYVDAMKKHNLHTGDDTIYYCDNYDDAVVLVNDLCDRGNIPDAIFAVNDLTAIGAQKTLQFRKIAVPEQTAVAGFANELFAEVAYPGLTTIDQNGQLMGEKAVALLIRRIETQKMIPYETELVPTKLIIRGSTSSDVR